MGKVAWGIVLPVQDDMDVGGWCWSGGSCFGGCLDSGCREA